MARRNRFRIHGVKTKDWAERAVFIFAFLAGVGGIILLKSISVPPIWAAIFAGGMIVFYVSFAMLFGRVQVEPEMVGDNCYYLGFLFTLASLSYTLAELAATGGDLDARSEMIGKVIGGFGVALSSTILGVFLRVVLMQVRPDIVARDREMHIELHESVREFRRQLASSVLAIKQFSTETVQHSQERDRKIAEGLERSRIDLAEKSESLVKDLANKTEAMVNELLSGIKAASLKSTEEASATLSTQVAEAAKAPVERLKSVLADMSSATETLGTAQNRVARGLEESIREIEKSLQGLAASLVKSDNAANASLDAIAPSRLEEAASGLRETLEKSAGEIEAAMNQLRDTVVEGTERLEKSFTTIENAAKTQRSRFPLFTRKGT